MDIESQFWNLVDTANELEADAWHVLKDDSEELIDSNRMVEPTYLAICKLVMDHPVERDVFVRCFSELVLQNRKSPWTLIPFCIRVLRMPEIKEVLHREMDRLGPGTLAYAKMMNYCSCVMHSYSDDIWEYAFAFDTLAHELSGDGGDQR